VSEDATLVRRILQGDPLATRELVSRFQGEIFGLCVRYVGSPHDAEDISQEVFVRVFRSLKGWDSTRPLRPWICRIAVNRCRTWLSNKPKRPEPVDFLHETPARSQEDDSRELVDEIQTALELLRPDYRGVFTMFHEQGCSYDEIAEVFERPVGTIKTWLHRARTEVLTYLQNRGMVPKDESAESSSPPRDNE